MTLAQWLFHYMEIAKLRRIDVKPTLQKLTDIETSIQAFYLLIDNANGVKLIDAINDARNAEGKDKSSKKKESTNATQSNDDKYEDLLTDEDKELWSFMQEQPTTIKETREMQNVGKFILPTKSKQDLIDGQFKIVDSSKDIKKPKLGFKK